MLITVTDLSLLAVQPNNENREDCGIIQAKHGNLFLTACSTQKTGYACEIKGNTYLKLQCLILENLSANNFMKEYFTSDEKL